VSIEPHVLALLSSLQASHPQMRLFLNGLSVTSTYAGILDYVPPGDGVDCEYIGWSSPSQTEPFRDGDMLDGVIAAAHVRRKTVACYSYAAASDVEARITSLARYWLVFAPHVYFQYMTADYHQSVDYFPEYDIELGPPLKPWLASRADITVGPIYARHFARGFALYNPGSASVPVSFPAPMYVVSATGAHSSKQGGTGQVVFLGPTHSTTLAPKRGAIVVRYPWTSR
jgi:hypothetical protein